MSNSLILLLSAQEEVVQDLKHQLNDLKREYQTALSFVQTCERALTRHERTEHELKVAMQRMEDESEALRDVLDKENAEEDGRIDSLQVALQEAKTDLAVQEGSFKDAQEAMKNHMQIMRETMREMGSQTTEVEVLTENARVAESERSIVSNKRQEILSEKNAAIARIQKQKEDRDKIHAKREELVERVLSYIEKASMVSARVSVGEGDTAEGLDHKLHKLQNDLKHHNQQYVFPI
jgi:chromosome segregation ATPase